MIASTRHSPASTLDVFEAFLRNALDAQQRNESIVRDTWLDAARHLFPTDGASVGAMLRQLATEQRLVDAEAIAGTLAQLEPHNALAQFNLGLALQFANRHDEAIAPYLDALAIDPDLYSLRNNLAAALLDRDPASSEAARLLETALECDTRDANLWVNLAKVRLARFDLAGSLAASEQAVRFAPDDPVVVSNHGQKLREAQRWDDAEHHATRALQLAPDYAGHRSNLGMLHLLRGRYAAGWPGHEARWDGSKELAGKRPVFPGPTWTGQPLAGKTLLLWGEQGMGDLLQFCRYVPLLAERVHREGGRLVWNSFPQMGGLLGRTLARFVDEFTLGGGLESLPPFDYEVSMVTLPYVFDTREDTIPSHVPYLRADPAAIDGWRARLAGETRLKVGLTWTGSRTHQRNPFRRVGLERHEAYLRDLDNVAFYSLQPDAAADVAAARSAGFDIADHTGEFKSFDDTAAFIGALDLVISVCTSVAHLSGALGQRTWVLLDVNPHWVWLLDRPDSPWYPTATLYRQSRFAEWDAVFERLRADLGKLAGEAAGGTAS
ncbi:tetratricopeptide repeat-containing glycosyltransferase family protein [Caballeronia sp. LZ035]|uniref:tetratricopeptide repeat-containing glycosyltransferase family protein n=1 Tax=Caballeronia sp. LZ035 TaxID=3038568 RepID=UPI002856A8DA|nr:tetratricopeptide repeat-containing glycosyltransferase family protein [Caballeronia sp. LZ035]MDR5758094.1 tetratricopeptide repeat-containing glycosyltransferase family protein [Caballeronia sp. LZ035]